MTYTVVKQRAETRTTSRSVGAHVHRASCPHVRLISSAASAAASRRPSVFWRHCNCLGRRQLRAAASTFPFFRGALKQCGQRITGNPRRNKAAERERERERDGTAGTSRGDADKDHCIAPTHWRPATRGDGRRRLLQIILHHQYLPVRRGQRVRSAVSTTGKPLPVKTVFVNNGRRFVIVQVLIADGNDINTYGLM